MLRTLSLPQSQSLLLWPDGRPANASVYFVYQWPMAKSRAPNPKPTSSSVQDLIYTTPARVPEYKRMCCARAVNGFYEVSFEFNSPTKECEGVTTLTWCGCKVHAQHTPLDFTFLICFCSIEESLPFEMRTWKKSTIFIGELGRKSRKNLHVLCAFGGTLTNLHWKVVTKWVQFRHLCACVLILLPEHELAGYSGHIGTSQNSYELVNVPRSFGRHIRLIFFEQILRCIWFKKGSRIYACLPVLTHSKKYIVFKSPRKTINCSRKLTKPTTKTLTLPKPPMPNYPTLYNYTGGGEPLRRRIGLPQTHLPSRGGLQAKVGAQMETAPEITHLDTTHTICHSATT